MKIVLIGATGTIGLEVAKMLENDAHEVIRAGRSAREFQVDIACRESLRTLYKKLGAFDAVVNAAGSVAFGPLERLSDEQWQRSLGSKLLGQIQLVQEAIPYINERGSFTLVSGILSEEYIRSGVAATTVNHAIEGFVRAAAIELPKGLRINVVSPTLLKESENEYGALFPGFIPVEGWKVAQAYKRSVMGAQTGQVFSV